MGKNRVREWQQLIYVVLVRDGGKTTYEEGVNNRGLCWSMSDEDVNISRELTE